MKQLSKLQRGSSVQTQFDGLRLKACFRFFFFDFFQDFGGFKDSSRISRAITTILDRARRLKF